jgi:hypothetical protein
MVPGVHASIGVARRMDEVTTVLGHEGWPWLGRPGRLATREVTLSCRPPRSFCLRIFTTLGVGRQGPLWCCQLADAASQPSLHPVLDAQLSLESLPTGVTRLHLSGRFARDLAGMGGAIPISVSRLAANALARALLEQIAAAIEGQPTAGAATVATHIGSNGPRAGRSAKVAARAPIRANGRPSARSDKDRDNG